MNGEPGHHQNDNYLRQQFHPECFTRRAETDNAVIDWNDHGPGAGRVSFKRRGEEPEAVVEGIAASLINSY